VASRRCSKRASRAPRPLHRRKQPDTSASHDHKEFAPAAGSPIAYWLPADFCTPFNPSRVSSCEPQTPRASPRRTGQSKTVTRRSRPQPRTRGRGRRAPRARKEREPRKSCRSKSNADQSRSFNPFQSADAQGLFLCRCPRDPQAPPVTANDELRVAAQQAKRKKRCATTFKSPSGTNRGYARQ